MLVYRILCSGPALYGLYNWQSRKCTSSITFNPYGVQCTISDQGDYTVYCQLITRYKTTEMSYFQSPTCSLIYIQCFEPDFLWPTPHEPVVDAIVHSFIAGVHNLFTQRYWFYKIRLQVLTERNTLQHRVSGFSFTLRWRLTGYRRLGRW